MIVSSVFDEDKLIHMREPYKYFHLLLFYSYINKTKLQIVIIAFTKTFKVYENIQ